MEKREAVNLKSFPLTTCKLVERIKFVNIIDIIAYHLKKRRIFSNAVLKKFENALVRINIF